MGCRLVWRQMTQTTACTQNTNSQSAESERTLSKCCTLGLEQRGAWLSSKCQRDGRRELKKERKDVSLCTSVYTTDCPARPHVLQDSSRRWERGGGRAKRMGTCVLWTGGALWKQNVCVSICPLIVCHNVSRWHSSSGVSWICMYKLSESDKQDHGQLPSTETQCDFNRLQTKDGITWMSVFTLLTLQPL